MLADNFLPFRYISASLCFPFPGIELSTSALFMHFSFHSLLIFFGTFLAVAVTTVELM